MLVADLLEDGEPAEDRWVYQLRGYAWAHLANARRVLGNLPAGDEAYQMADSWWQAGHTDRPTCPMSSPFTPQKQAAVMEHPKVFDHVGLLVNGPPSLARSPFI